MAIYLHDFGFLSIDCIRRRRIELHGLTVGQCATCSNWERLDRLDSALFTSWFAFNVRPSEHTYLMIMNIDTVGNG